jgi:hypothetical protein
VISVNSVVKKPLRNSLLELPVERLPVERLPVERLPVERLPVFLRLSLNGMRREINLRLCATPCGQYVKVH